MGRPASAGAAIERLSVGAFSVPTESAESDGTLTWHSTTLVVVQADAGGMRGLGYTYGAAAAARVVTDLLAPVLEGRDAMAIRAAWGAGVQAVRNAGRPGIASHAISAVDVALWDLKARLLNVPLAALLGQTRVDVPVYGSGGFTSYSDEEMQAQLAGWTAAGVRAVKMKIGREPERDAERVRLARNAIGAAPALFVDANGAYDRKQALVQAERFAEHDVTWFEEPVSSDDLEGLRLIRDRAPAGMSIAAGEYGYDTYYFRRMLAAGAADVLQVDATRCGGITGFLQAAALSEAFGVPLSAHTAPAVHLVPCCAVPTVLHVEYFHDHVRIERALFDGLPPLRNGRLKPDLSSPGLGLAFKRSDAERYAVS